MRAEVGPMDADVVPAPFHGAGRNHDLGVLDRLEPVTTAGTVAAPPEVALGTAGRALHVGDEGAALGTWRTYAIYSHWSGALGEVVGLIGLVAQRRVAPTTRPRAMARTA